MSCSPKDKIPLFNPPLSRPIPQHINRPRANECRPGGNASSGGGGGGRKRPLDRPDRPSHQKKRNRRHRLCLHCANYHGGTCRVPVCENCGLNHYAHMACLNAATNLRNRLAMHSGSAQGDVDVSIISFLPTFPYFLSFRHSCCNAEG